jgi:threonine dehydrogenase-like Zn-dependent dehydrogenase
MEGKALWHLSPTHSVTRTLELPKPSGQECIIKSAFSMVSLGTERLIAKGGVPDVLFEKMRVPYMQGAFGFPLTYGYSLSGLVIDGPQEWIGERVHCLHPHQSYCLVQSSDLTVIPSDVPLDRAVLTSNLETVVNALWDARPFIGQRILVIGYGLIGSLIAYLLQPMSGIEIEVLEINDSRIGWARHMGLKVIRPSSNAEDLYDMVFHTSATESGLQYGIDHLRQDGDLIELSWYGKKSVHLDLGTSFHYGRKRIISSQVSHVARPAMPQWSKDRRKELVFQLLKDPRLDFFLGRRIPFSQAVALFQILRNEQPTAVNYYFDYS